jgi:hypothetical protein
MASRNACIDGKTDCIGTGRPPSLRSGWLPSALGSVGSRPRFGRSLCSLPTLQTDERDTDILSIEGTDPDWLRAFAQAVTHDKSLAVHGWTGSGAISSRSAYDNLIDETVLGLLGEGRHRLFGVRKLHHIVCHRYPSYLKWPIRLERLTPSVRTAGRSLGKPFWGELPPFSPSR